MADRDERERVMTGFRFSPSLRRQLQEAAEKNGNSVNAEATARLERSLRDEALGEVIFGDRVTYAWLDQFARLLRAASMVSGRDWRADRATFLEAIKVLRKLVESGPEALMGKVPERWRDTTEHMAFTMIDLALEGVLKRQQEEMPPAAVASEAGRGFE
jgi:hypothetical protein